MSALEKVAYADGSLALTGWMARPAGKPHAAMVLFPTIANVNPAMERRAAMLAEAGFLTMIADFYGEPVESFAAAGALAEQLRATPEHYRQRLRAAIAALSGLPEAAGLPGCRYVLSAIAWADRPRWKRHVMARSLPLP
jgi:dienelactone hydrolase